MTEDTRTLSHKKQGESLREKIRNNEFTPAITNSYCHSKYNVIFNNIHTGITELNVRSFFEALFIFQNLDKKLSYEELRIPYVDKYGNRHIYIPDFIDYINKCVYEIKPYSELERRNNIEKIIALKNWCKDNAYEYSIITENELRQNMYKFDLSYLEFMNDDSIDKFKKSLKRYKLMNI